MTGRRSQYRHYADLRASTAASETHEELAYRLDLLEWRASERDSKVQSVFETIQHLIEAPEPEPKRQIGYPANADDAARSLPSKVDCKV